MAILHKVSNSRWGLENRNLTITAQALFGSLLNYGLTVTGSAASLEDFEGMGARILNPVARKIAGLGYTIQREVLYTLADVRSAHNHYLLKVANVMDRILRAKGTQPQRRLQQFLESKQRGGEPWIPNRNHVRRQGPVGRQYITEDHWQLCWRRNRMSREPCAKDVTWWRVEYDAPDEPAKIYGRE